MPVGQGPGLKPLLGICGRRSAGCVIRCRLYHRRFRVALPLEKLKAAHPKPMFWKLANNNDPNSLAAKLRQKRRTRCREIIMSIPKPMKILNVGGVESEFRAMGVIDEPGISFTVLNVYAVPTTRNNVRSVVGDARDMTQFHDQEFDFVFSNSVIEHVGDEDDIRRMAGEIRRVGRRYYVQTPNRYFPIEPHFLVPMFQFLPVWVRKRLVQNLSLGWHSRIPDPIAAEELVRSVNLLTIAQMRSLFPDGVIVAERVLGLTKSIQSIKAAPQISH